MDLISERALEAALILRRFRRHFATAQTVRSEVARRQLRPPSHTPPQWLACVRFKTFRSHGWTCYRLTPQGSARSNPREIAYFHGGAYVQEITPWHWTFLARIAVKTGASITVPIYPLAPTSTVLQTVPTATSIVSDLLAVGGSPTLMGDSSGAGLALAIAQALRDRDTCRPNRLVLISPWLDVTTRRLKNSPAAARDRILAQPGLAEAGRLYAGAAGTTHPWASPILRDITQLPNISVFTGTHDILNADAHALNDIARRDSATLDLIEAAGSQHDYPLFPTPSGNLAVNQISDLIKRP